MKRTPPHATLNGMSRKVADQLVGMLADAGIRRMYGIVGDSLNPVIEALQRDGRIRWIHVRHEETAAFAAGAEAQITGQTACCSGSSGPGNMHLINGLYDAWRSAAPVFALASHIPLSQVGGDYFQETHPQIFFRECTAFCELVSEPSQAAAITGTALRKARETPGVGMIVLSGDVAQLPADEGAPAAGTPRGGGLLTPSPHDLRELAALINSRKRVTFFCGAGCAGAREPIVALARKIGAPIAYTFRGKDIMEKDNPCAVGMTGLLGWGDALQAMHDCDLLVMWGTDFPYRPFLPDGRKVPIAQIDRDASRLGRRARLALGIQGDAAATALELLPGIESGRSSEHLERSLSRHRKLIRKLFAYVRHVNEKAPLRPEYITRVVSDYAEPDAIFTIDTGTPDIWAARYLDAGGARRVIGSFKHGSMACGLAMAIGAQAACPKRQVIALCGDGGLTMLPGDLLTLLQENLSVKILVYDNSALDFINMEMRAAGILPTHTALRNPDLAAMAQAMGLYAERLETPAETVPAVRRWLRQPGPALLDAVVDAHALALPPDITLMQAYGFAAALTKHALEGELGVVRRLLRHNLRLF
ncbi:MAG: thiamine pyrophosphate-dependent enzyme [Akkermansiaceae bacterium]|nr:thiamine pyrophosphate-dependent enzyme [Akkermansiaceae bacterium]